MHAAVAMSKERARRREEREVAKAAERSRRAAARERSERRATTVGALTAPAARTGSLWSRWWRRTFPPADPFRGRRQRQWGIVGGLFVLVQLLAWWILPGNWGLRLGILGLSCLLTPVLRVLLFDRG
jgi:Flp pilus assembly protein TadB